MEKINQSKYLFLGQYFVIGVILTAFVYQFVTQSLLNKSIDLSLLFDKGTIAFVIACIIGSIVGGLFYIIISLNDKTRIERETRTWVTIKDAKFSLFLLKVMFALSFAAFVGMLVKRGMEMESSNSFMSALFSSDNMISYVGAVVAACVFAIPLSIGAMKRLKLLYGN
ncbi:hypothetical protein [Ancylomarina sp. 16SWW S1-10-2]|uniref:hypothetical protein n=1 Tax=Ancylomarina sp. 16SWW S1-10-2 TaxID=2499681 RepID=UPI0012AE29D8|nr:hypothetical protein [Ancylomarina sp. 16SWW S1-10-2]MRT94365.1 hypothetical protein [Ancylomarina sp. 16SWW S1-10-2]